MGYQGKGRRLRVFHVFKVKLPNHSCSDFNFAVRSYVRYDGLRGLF